MDAELAEAVAAMIAERETTRTTKWRRERAADARERAERKTARDAGLRLRHAAKLRRNPVG